MSALSGMMRCFVIISSISISICQSNGCNDDKMKEAEGHPMLKPDMWKRFDVNESEVHTTNPKEPNHGMNNIAKRNYALNTLANEKSTRHNPADKSHFRKVLMSNHHAENKSRNHVTKLKPFIRKRTINSDKSHSRERRNVREKKTTKFQHLGNLTSSNDDAPSCLAKCGQKRLSPCSCDYRCFVLRTCCEDVIIECPFLKAEARTLLGNELVDNPGIASCDFRLQYFIVDKCVWPEEPTELGTDGDFMSVINSMAIVMDNDTGLVFRNRRIYNCYKNNSDSLRSWTAYFPALHGRQQLSIANPRATLMGVDPRKATFSPQTAEMAGHKCVPVIESCKKELEYLDPDRLCGKFISHYGKPDGKKYVSGVHEYPLYGNRHCLYCNLNTTDGKHGIMLDDSVNFRLNGISVLMDFTNAGKGLKINLKVMGSSQERDWKCSVNDSSIPMNSDDRFVNNLPQCTAFSCGTMINNNGKCFRRGKQTLLLRHPPKKSFKPYRILQLANFVVCYLAKGDWKFKDFEKSVLFFHRTAVAESVYKEATQYTVPHINEYFVIQMHNLNTMFGESFTRGNVRYAAATEDALRYWYIRNGFVIDNGDGFLRFVEERKAVIENQENDERNVLLGLIVSNSRSSGRHTSPFAIGSNIVKSDRVDYEALSRCNGEVFDKFGRGQNGAGSFTVDLWMLMILGGWWFGG